MAMPSRPALNGRQVLAVIAWMPSQARRQPGVLIASLPPTMIMSAMPARSSIAPWAIAWPDDEQAR